MMIGAVLVALAAVLGGYHIRYISELADQNSALLQEIQAANCTIVSAAVASDSVWAWWLLLL